jgi:hypothetical protein
MRDIDLIVIGSGTAAAAVIRRGAEIIDAARKMQGWGIVPGGLRLDWGALQAHKRTFTDPVPEKREETFAEMGVATSSAATCRRASCVGCGHRLQAGGLRGRQRQARCSGFS